MNSVVLIVLDGWGLAPPGPGNAISLAHLTHIPSLWTNYPHAELSASGVSVGLPEGEDGNTETGHINIGAGRIVYQDLPRISEAIHDGSFATNDAFLGAVHYACEHKSAIHLMGVLSDAGVHASRDHLYALLELLKKAECSSPVYLHIFTDGRDASPKSALRFVKDLESRCALIGIGAIATVMGRYFAMDRDNRWDRTRDAYLALTGHGQNKSYDPLQLLEISYTEGITDEFIKPAMICDQNGNPVILINQMLSSWSCFPTFAWAFAEVSTFRISSRMPAVSAFSSTSTSASPSFGRWSSAFAMSAS